MKTLSRSFTLSPLRTLALSVLLVSSPLARGQITAWTGGNGDWSNPAKWSNGVPTSSSAVVIGSPYLDVDATIGSLTFQKGEANAPLTFCGFGSCITDNRNPRTLIVQNGTTFEDLSGGVSDPSGVRLGFSITAIMGSNFQLGMTNLPAGVLVGQWTVEDWDGTESATPALIQFRDADIRENKGEVWLQGPDAAIRDQNTGENAFRNLTTNNHIFSLADGNVLSTTGDLTNNKDLFLFNYGEGLPTRLTVGGKLINNQDGYFQIQGGGQVSVTGDFENNGTPPTGGVLLVNSTRTVGDTIFTVQGNLINGAGAALDVYGTPNPSRLVVAGNLSNAGLLHIEGAGSMEVAGTVTLTAPGQITMVEASPTQSSRLSAAQINLGEDTSFDAQGTIFSIVVGSGVFSPGISSPAEVTINGSFTLNDTARLVMQVGGTVPRAGYDQIKHVTPTPTFPGAAPTGAVATVGTVLDGTLDISLIKGFEKTITRQDTFSILVSDRMLSGAFNNVASGGRLQTTSGHGSFLVTYAGQNSVVLSQFELGPLKVVSRKTHGTNGTFDVLLPITGAPGVEPRRGSGPSQNDHSIVVTFAGPVTFASASVTSGTGSVASSSISGNDVIIELAGVANAQQLAITLSNVSNGAVTNDVVLPLRVLLGNTNADGNVNAGDALQTRNRAGQALTPANFRSDVNVDGTINSGDALLVKNRSGTSIP
ncbi:MAG TPA: dockerin type I domain-containing protein [Chthoniobacterales bacterium]